MKQNNHSNYNIKREIDHRIDRLDRGIRDGQIEKSKMFKDYNIAESKLNGRINMLKERRDTTDEYLQEAEAQLVELRKRRKALGFEHEIIITEHAMLRYCERYLGIDMEEVHQAILKLPKKDVTKFGNTIVTVYPEADDYLEVDE